MNTFAANSPAPRFLAAAAALLFLASPVRAEKRAVGGDQTEYHAVTIEKDGSAGVASLDDLTTAVERDVQAGAGEIVVLIHGFAVTPRCGTEEFTDIARRLRRQGEPAGLRPSIVGVHWDSDAGPLGSWMVQATAQRLTSLLGMRRAVRNPYLEKRALAARTGRTGLRAVLFRLQDRFPQVPVHLFSHSLGAEVVVSALAPEAGDPSLPAEQPNRPLHLGAVVLAGADLDYDRFSRRDDAAVR